MSRVVLYPYPRIHQNDITWNEWTAQLDGRTIDLEEIADAWDADADLTFGLHVSTSPEALETAQADKRLARLVVAASCRDTAFTATSEAGFISDGKVLTATAEITVPGHDVSEALDLKAHLIAPLPDGTSWLNRRIIADARPRRVALDSSLAGFPTVAFSFNAESVPDAPWRLVVIADDAQAPFAHSVRLELNEDYTLVQELLDGQISSLVQAELDSSISRVLIGTVSRLMDSTSGHWSPEDLAAEAPDSIAAAAQRASKQYLKKSLNAALKDYRLQPERFEHALAGGTGLLKGR